MKSLKSKIIVNSYTIDAIDEERKDRKADEKLIKRFETYFQNYSYRLGTILAIEKHFEVLYKPENADIHNTLFQYMKMTFNGWNCLNIYSFFEPSSRVDGLKQFLLFLEGAHKNIYTKRFYEKLIGRDDDYNEIVLPDVLESIRRIKTELEWIICNPKTTPGFERQPESIKMLNSIVFDIKFWRDKYYAHKDRDLFVKKKSVNRHVGTEHIKLVVEWLSKSLNELYLPFKRSTNIFCPINATDGLDWVVRSLHKSNEYRALLHRADVKKSLHDGVTQSLAMQNKEVDLNQYLYGNPEDYALGTIELTDDYRIQLENFFGVNLKWDGEKMKKRKKYTKRKKEG